MANTYAVVYYDIEKEAYGCLEIEATSRGEATKLAHASEQWEQDNWKLERTYGGSTASVLIKCINRYGTVAKVDFNLADSTVDVYAVDEPEGLVKRINLGDN